MCLATWTNSEPLLWARFLLLTLTASTKGKHGACFSPLPDLVAGLACEEGGETGLPSQCTCTQSRRPSITCSWENVGWKGCSRFSPQSRWLCRSGKWAPRRCASTQPPRSGALGAAERLSLPAEARITKPSAGRQHSSRSECTQPGGFQMLMGLHASFIHFVLESSLLLVLLRVNLSLRFVWLNGPKVWHCDGAFCRHTLS